MLESVLVGGEQRHNVNAPGSALVFQRGRFIVGKVHHYQAVHPRLFAGNGEFFQPVAMYWVVVTH